jgi:hypothetical protein
MALTATMGMDPTMVLGAVKLGTDLLGKIFGGGGPSAAEIAAYQAEVARREAAERQKWLIGGGLALAGIVTAVLISRRAS